MAMSRYARFEHLRVDEPDEAGVVELVLDAPNLNAVGEGAHGDLAAVWRESWCAGQITAAEVARG